MATHFGQKNSTWIAGDFNYDGVVNALDFNAIATNYGQVMSSPAIAGTVVPEPGIALLCCAAPLLARTRLRRRR
jgi:hypothetical protein